MTSIPATMRSLGVKKYGPPSAYEILEFPVPEIEEPDEVLIKVHAASIITGDTQMAAGKFSMLASLPMPLKMGLEGAGVVIAVGSQAKKFKVGDAVYGGSFSRPVFPIKKAPGWISEYAVARESFLIPKPPHLSFVEAASLLGSVITAYQSIQRALELMGRPKGSLEDKTVYVPGALSATGSVGVQLLKNVYGAKKVISTVSTPKMKLVEQYLPGVVDQLIDYKTQNIAAEVGKGSIDVIYNTQWNLTSVFPLANPKTGVITTIAGVPTSGLMREVLGPQYMPFWAAWIIDAVNIYYRWLLRGTNVQLEFISGNPGNGEDVEMVGEIVARQQVRPVFTQVDFNDLDSIRKECNKVSTGKSGIGRLVFRIV